MKKIKMILMTLALVVLALPIIDSGNFVFGQRPTGSERRQQGQNSPVGTWQSGESTLVIRADGTLTLNGKPYTYKISNSALVISNGDKTFNFPYELSGDYLTVTLSSQRMMYKRVSGGNSESSNSDDIFLNSKPKNGGAATGIVGRWKSDKGILEFRDNGTMSINGEQYTYQINGSTLAVSSSQGTLNFPFQISGNQLIMGAQSRQVIYVKIEDGSNTTDENEENRPSPNNKQMKSGGIIGRWQSDEATIDIRPNGTITINDEQYSYQVNGSTIIVSGSEGSMSFPFQLSGDKMIVSVQGRRVIYSRIGASSNSGGGVTETTGGKGGVLPELVGKWCYYASVRPNSENMRTSDRCFTLHPNGTYEYYGENYTSGGSGTYTSATRDSGRWTATATTITAHSSTNGTTSYRLEKRNNKNNDPMLVLDGEPFVTYYKKQPW